MLFYFVIALSKHPVYVLALLVVKERKLYPVHELVEQNPVFEHNPFFGDIWNVVLLTNLTNFFEAVLNDVEGVALL